jgi:hypothetical protein
MPKTKDTKNMSIYEPDKCARRWKVSVFPQVCRCWIVIALAAAAPGPRGAFAGEPDIDRSSCLERGVCCDGKLLVDEKSGHLFVLGEQHVAVTRIEGGGEGNQVRFVALPRAVWMQAQEYTLSDIALDPQGRGFLAVAISANPPVSDPGVVAFYSIPDMELLTIVQVGYGPVALAFDRRGEWLAVANSGGSTELTSWLVDREPVDVQVVTVNRPGSVSIVDLRACKDLAALRETRRGAARAVDLKGEAVKTALELGVLNQAATGQSPSKAELPFALEPRAVVVTGGLAIASLPANDAVAIVDLNRAELVRIQSAKPQP